MRELALLFLRLGFTAFGGPAAHIAMMEDEVVRRRGWLTREELLDLLGAANLIPGPNSTELAIHIGYRRNGWPGLLVAGACFILPAALLVTLIAWAYVRYAKLPQAEAVLYGIKPVIIAIIVQALWRLGATALKSPVLIGIAVGGVVAAFLGVNELIVLFGAGALIAVARGTVTHGQGRALLALPLATPAVGLAAVGLWPIFLFFVKVGAVLFGSGYVLIAFLRADLVERWGWLTESQLLDAVAVGQITPGPVFTTATFIGYLLGGLPGAAVATVGIFLPAFVFVALTAPLVSRLRQSKVAGAFLDGVNAATVALIAFVTWQLARTALVDVPTIALAALSAVVLLRFNVNSAWLVAAGALAGLAFAIW
jgi:chromate transporter